MITGNKSVLEAYDVYYKMKVASLDSFLKSGVVVIVHSVPVTTNVVGSNPVHGDVYSIQHYVMKFVSDL